MTLFLPSSAISGMDLRGARVSLSRPAGKCVTAPLERWLTEHEPELRGGWHRYARTPAERRALWNRLIEESGLERA